MQAITRDHYNIMLSSKRENWLETVVNYVKSILFSAGINLQAKFRRPHLNVPLLRDSGSLGLKYKLNLLFIHVNFNIQWGEQQYSVFYLIIIP